MNIKQTLEIAKKMDIYGRLLTSKQQKVLNSYINYNGSISEIAEDLGTSRQAVLDIIKRTILKLDEYEKKLKFCQKLDKIYSKISKCGLTSQQEKVIIELVKTMED